MKLLYTIIAVILSFTLLIEFSYAVCTQRYCGVEGAQCNSNRACAKGFYCLSNQCTKGKDELETCSHVQQCRPGLSCVNHGQFRVCKAAHFLGAGEKCTENLECYGSLKCTKGLCKLNKGANCTMDEECGHHGYCKGIACQTRLQPGSDCLFNEDQCCHGYVCGKVDEYTDYKKGKCIPMFSKKSGESCFSQYGECDMADGLFCPSTSGITSTCADIDRFNIKCKTSSDCDTMWEECECNGNKTNLSCHSKFNIDSTCSKLYLALQNCASAKDCTIKTNINDASELNENSCIMKKCKEQALCFYSRCLKFEFGCKMPEGLQCTGEGAAEAFTNFTLPARTGLYNDSYGEDAEATKKPKPGSTGTAIGSEEASTESDSVSDEFANNDNSEKGNNSKDNGSKNNDENNEKNSASIVYISLTLTSILLSLLNLF
ncbi:hypothetical protein DICPUDRAFT_76788 [Dictyostelium purpureum]|uniref:Dickkopf N-terminal cysteine-rich domain-containing protein n=1 Tax=Dictyostelium purpureum TaxID=5786 RepID=F0ZEM7_DICPU|nr:uncharacterized protein DICPUDRAFT_76788 [Dictyostelium purpureum]EGC37599.1 hypothetical protein DICPUDRAFT_76788 [Dictyostelium purpureum]|eukprot:XP_003285860.1 hypothetical protein DICPUDRAFT_76788 [Dictyostelium purpureum]